MKKLDNPFVFLCFAFLISVTLVFTFNFFCQELNLTKERPKNNYVMELTYADGSKKILTQYAEKNWIDEEPRIESAIIHDGYYVCINNRDYYGVVALKCLKKYPSEYKTVDHYHTHITRHDCYKDGCSLFDAFFESDEWLLAKNWK